MWGPEIEHSCSYAASKFLQPCNNWVLFCFRFLSSRLCHWGGICYFPDAKYTTVHSLNVFKIRRWDKWSGSTLNTEYSSFGLTMPVKFSFGNILPVFLLRKESRFIRIAGFRTRAFLCYPCFMLWWYWLAGLSVSVYICRIFLGSVWYLSKTCNTLFKDTSHRMWERTVALSFTPRSSILSGVSQE